MACLRRDNRVIVKRTSDQVKLKQNENTEEVREDYKTFIDYARWLCSCKKFNEAISILTLVSKLNKNLPMEAVNNLVERLLETYSPQSATVSCYTDPWSCVYCSSVLEEPVTLTCGHSSCKKCMLRDVNSVCKKCKVKYLPVEEDPIDVEPYVKVNVVVSGLVTKYWSRELESAKLRAEGNRLYQINRVEDSIKKYEEAITICPDDYLSHSNRSNALYKATRYSEALADADKSVSLKSDWSKSYYRRAMALAALHRYEEAVVAFFQCFILEDKFPKHLKTDIVKAMYKMITVKAKEAEDTLPNLNVMRFSSHPNLNLSQNKAEASDGESETDSEILPTTEGKRLNSILSKIDEGVKKIINLSQTKSQRYINPEAMDKEDFECALCYRLLWQPVTTPCGHTYCRACIDRSLDHKPECPLCKASIPAFNNSNTGVTEFVEATVKRMLPGEYCQRQKIHEDEMNELLGSGDNQIPVFVCTMSFPAVVCPLHVFEPRYRLMIRRAMESGTRQFGMCVGSQETGFSEYGTMLEIRDIQYFADGRSVVDTIGGKRFRVLSRGVKDGYNTAKVEYLQDDTVEGNDLKGLKIDHDKIRALAEEWFSKMNKEIKKGVQAHYGDMPSLEFEYWKLANGPAWCWWVLAIMPLDKVSQQNILSKKSLGERLKAIERILNYMKSNGAF